MKSFRSYLTESVRVYSYKIKLAGENTPGFLDLFCHNLQKFDPVKISSPKSTPIQKDPYGFPGLKDQSITIIDVEFRYPATEPMVQQLARLLGKDENLVRMIQSNYDDSITQETEQYANQMKDSPVLDHKQMEDYGKAASKEYSQSYLGRIKEQEKGNEIKQSYAAPKTPDAFDPFAPYLDDKKLGDKSPMTTISRPPRPATGAKPR